MKIEAFTCAVSWFQLNYSAMQSVCYRFNSTILRRNMLPHSAERGAVVVAVAVAVAVAAAVLVVVVREGRKGQDKGKEKINSQPHGQ